MFSKLKRIGATILAGMMTLTIFSTPYKTVKADILDREVRAYYENNKLVIENDYIGRTFSTIDNKLKTEKITNKRTSNGTTEFIPGEGSEEFKIRVTKTDSKPIVLPAISREGWTAEADSYQNVSGPNDGPASNLIDGNIQSIWHTNYGGGQGARQYPYNVLFTLNGVKKFQSFSYTPRKEGEGVNGNIKGYELWAATSDTKLTEDSDKWTKIAEGNFKYDGINPIYVNLDKEVSANQLKFVAVSSNNGQSFAGGAEFNLHEEKAPVVKNDREFASSNLELDGEPVISSTNAIINNVAKTGKKVKFNFKPYTFKGVNYTISENIVMYEGDHFMRKYLEIGVPDDQKESAVIDYIDLESMNVNKNDATWTIPTDAGGIVEMDQFKANLGQPIYIQGMFFGSEFPLTDTQIVDETGYIRYYSGKSFEKLGEDNQLAKTEDGSAMYVTWQTVAGAARSTENEVIQADFFEYISSIATPSEFRIQYNSWFDNMMRIDDKNILESFIEVDRELNKVEVRPIESYVVDDGWNNYNNTSVVDAVRSGTSLNETGFWEFNTKFPEGLTPSSELVNKFGSDFGVWVGPRGGYNFYGALADILAKSGKGSKAGGSIDVADREYIKHFGDMSVNWQSDYGVNYWKWDGFADRAQFNSFQAADGVPGYANRHMTGGYQHMYHVTDMWEAWIDLFERVRENSENINKLWISLTCYVNPSPWYLQWANSVWLQCTADQADAGSSSSKMDRQITYRDAAYYDFIKNHEFQFPLANIYNHDPVYGKEGTGMNKNTATDEQFKNYLYMLATRGTAFWELYYSDSIMTDGKYEVTGEFLQWAEESYHMLKNAKMFGEHPNTGTTLGGNGRGENYPYGFSGFDGTDGIISLRNPATTAKEITFTFDRTMGVAENAGVLKYHLEHSYNLTEGTDAIGTLEYGKTYTITLQPDEVRILRVSKDGDTTAPKFTRAYTDGDKTITVKFDEKVNGNLFEVSGANIASINKSADGITYNIVLTEAPQDDKNLTIIARNIKDLAGNELVTKTTTTTYHKDSKVIENKDIDISGKKQISDVEKSINSNNGFTVSAKVKTSSNGSVVSQSNGYGLGINEEGKAYFTLNGAIAVSEKNVNDNVEHVVTGVKENNGILKLYIDGELTGSAYNEDNRFFEVKSGTTTIGSEGFIGKVGITVLDIAYGYDLVKELTSGSNDRKALDTTGMLVSVSGTDEGNKDDIFDNDPTTFWTSTKADSSIAKGNPYLSIDLNGSYIIDRVDYTKRFYNSSENIWKCTGNLRSYVLEVSNDGGKTWTEVKSGETFNDESFTEKANGGTTEITFESVKATNIRISGTASYHWQAENVNKFMTVADLKIFGEKQVATNLAHNKNIVGKWTSNNDDVTVNRDKPLENAVNGNKALTDYADLGSDSNKESSYIQVDIGKVSNIEAINLYRYWSDARTYKGTVIALSETETFSNPIIVYNSDTENIHGLGVGLDETYVETQDGKSFKLPEVKNARYVRVYMQGSNKGNTNHIVELEVMGVQDKNPEVPLNMTLLISILNELNSVDTANYTKNSVAAFNALINEGNSVVLNAKTQEEIDNMVIRLENAEEILVNTSELKIAIKDGEEVVAIKTTSSAQDLIAKIEEAKALFINGTTDSITAMIDALNEAKLSDKLVDRGNIDALADLIKSYGSLKESDYTVESWDLYKAKLYEADAIVEDNSNSSQADVDAAKVALEGAKNALVKAPVVTEVDKDELKKAIDNADEVDENIYTTTSYNTMKAAYDIAVEYLNSNTVTQEQVNERKKLLDDALNALERRADVTEGKKLLSSIQEENLKEDDYTEESWNTFAKAKVALEAAVKDNSDVNETKINEFIVALKDAKDKLKKVTPKVDKSELESLYNANKDKDGEEGYTSSSWNTFQNALKVADEILKNENATQEQINNALDNLTKAINELVEKQDPPIEEVNKESLQELYNCNKDKKEENYTEDSWKVFNNALNEAKVVLDDKESTQEDVNKALYNLKEAVNNLRDKTENPVPDTENSGNNSGEGGLDNNSGINNLPQTGGNNPMVGGISAILLVAVGVFFLFKKKRINNNI
ncbi:discoidin domain-containing protein [Clostridium sp.]|uniref:discoidin domain-containing protein n=1 Tax=Clostridium sp. TaxID=1506 RepID=UPI0025C5A150|nr:discoidin domain-containing protein [Clostridium sp.]